MQQSGTFRNGVVLIEIERVQDVSKAKIILLFTKTNVIERMNTNKQTEKKDCGLDGKEQ